MAINRTWMLGVAVAACLGGALMVVSQPIEPEGCPEGGCRVGYRFEDGGIAPEGWEPYATDDPVVALMDACLTYFMTGSLNRHPSIFGVTAWREDAVIIDLIEGHGRARIDNLPFNSPYGTFSCDSNSDYASPSWLHLLEWIELRFDRNPQWGRTYQSEEIGIDQTWVQTFRSDEFNATFRITSSPSRHSSYLSSPSGPNDGHAGVGLWIRVDYHGPEYGFGTTPTISF